jgi:hypothetical protein
MSIDSLFFYFPSPRLCLYSLCVGRGLGKERKERNDGNPAPSHFVDTIHCAGPGFYASLRYANDFLVLARSATTMWAWPPSGALRAVIFYDPAHTLWYKTKISHNSFILSLILFTFILNYYLFVRGWISKRIKRKGIVNWPKFWGPTAWASLTASAAQLRPVRNLQRKRSAKRILGLGHAVVNEVQSFHDPSPQYPFSFTSFYILLVPD